MIRQELLREIKQLTPAEQFRLVEEVLRSLRSTLDVPAASSRYIKLEGLWRGFSIDFDEIKEARRTLWSGLGRGFDE